MKRLTTILILSVMVLLGGCETIAGFGQDIQKAGKALEKKAKE